MQPVSRSVANTVASIKNLGLADKSVAPAATAVRLATLPNATIYHWAMPDQ
jgi:hypothetical protein